MKVLMYILFALGILFLMFSVFMDVCRGIASALVGVWFMLWADGLRRDIYGIPKK